MFIQKSDVRNLKKSFIYAFKGIMYCINNERNMRIHICMTVFVALFSYFFGTTSGEFIIILLCIGFVICSEMINTSIETIVNLQSPSYNNLAKIAKDVAAGAVAVSAIIAAIVGLIVFVHPTRLMNAIKLIFSSYVNIGMFIILIVVSILFIFNGPHLYGEKTTRIYNIKTKSKSKK